MQLIPLLLIAAVIFGICYLVDKIFSKLFRSKAQHRSCMAVRVSKTYGVIGTVLIIIGILAIITPDPSRLLLFGGIFVLLMGAALAAHYLTKGIFYDGESFLVTGLMKKGRTYTYRQISEQRLYLIQGGSIVIDLLMDDGSSVSVQSTMTGVYPFLDTAFAAWCLQTGKDPQSCDFHDPSKHWWFPHEEEV